MINTEAKGPYIPGLTKTTKTPPSLSGFVDPSQNQDQVLGRLYKGTSAGQEGQIAMEQAAGKAAGLQQLPMRDSSVNVTPVQSASQRQAEIDAAKKPASQPTTPGGLPPGDVFGNAQTGAPTGTPGFDAPEGFGQYQFQIPDLGDFGGGMGGGNGTVDLPGISYNNETKQWFNGYSGKTFDVDGLEVEAFDPNEELPALDDTAAEGTTVPTDTTPLDGFVTAPSDTDSSPSPSNVSIPPIQIQGMATVLGDPIMQKLVANMSVADFMAMIGGGFGTPEEQANPNQINSAGGFVPSV